MGIIRCTTAPLTGAVVSNNLLYSLAIKSKAKKKIGY